MLENETYIPAPDQPANMSAYGIADSDDLARLAKALNAFCARNRITRAEDRDRIAIKLMCLFRRGVVDHDQLLAELTQR